MKRGLTMVLLLALAACSPESSRAPRAGDTQLAVQWPMASVPAENEQLAYLPGFGPVNRLYRARDEIVGAGGDLYSVGDTEARGAVFNIYVYSDRVDATVQRLVQLEKQGKVPAAMRIGVADPLAATGEPAAYHVAWPVDLKTFDAK